MKTILKQMSSAIKSVGKVFGFGQPRKTAYEEYLCKSTDVYDLEARERSWDRHQRHKAFF